MKWISVKDDKPKENQEVLCLTDNTIGYATWKDNLFQHGESIGFRAPFLHDKMKWYWMPLPKPPDE